MSHVLVTGAASGIGRHLATVLAERGHTVVATDIHTDGLVAARTERGWDALGVRCDRLDVTEPASWEAVIGAAEARAPLDIVMNIAGFLRPGRAVAVEDRDIDLHLSVNVKGTILGTRAAARRMIPRRSGHIINIGSLASLSPVPGLSLYCASKFAVRGFSLSAAVELAAHGVALSLVLPDAVATPMLELQLDYEESALTFSGDRTLTVEDIERLIVDVVIPKRPLEVAIPFGRGALAKIASAIPSSSKLLYPLLKKKGLASQGKAKRGH